MFRSFVIHRPFRWHSTLQPNWRKKISLRRLSIYVRLSRSMRRQFSSPLRKRIAVIVEQDHPFCGVGAEVCYRIQKNIFDALDAPIIRVSQEEVPMPYNERLEKAFFQNAEKLFASMKQVCYSESNLKAYKIYKFIELAKRK